MKRVPAPRRDRQSRLMLKSFTIHPFAEPMVDFSGCLQAR
jgi:hypothetical protein